MTDDADQYLVLDTKGDTWAVSRNDRTYHSTLDRIISGDFDVGQCVSISAIYNFNVGDGFFSGNLIEDFAREVAERLHAEREPARWGLRNWCEANCELEVA